MLDVKTGRLSWGEGKALWPGMTHADFERSVLYQNELLNEAYKADRHNQLCNLKVQDIDGFPMAMLLRFDHHDFLCDIVMSQAEFYDWPEWPADVSQNDYLLTIKEKNDRFLATQLQNRLEGGRELGFEFDWGTISSTCSFVHNPDAQIILSIATWQFDPTFTPDNRPLYESIDSLNDSYANISEITDDEDEDEEDDDYYRNSSTPDNDDDDDDNDEFAIP